MKNIIAIVVTYNIGNKIIKLYKSAIKQVDKIIFIDNASNIETLDILKKLKNNNEKVIIQYNKKNYGLAKALNMGVKIAMNFNPKFILTLDHDSELQENMIEKMLKIYDHINEKENIGIISPIIYDINKKDYLFKNNGEDYEFIKEPIQSGSLIKSCIFKEIGLFNENLNIYYVDTEFCYRLNKNGYKCIQCNKIELMHEEGKKTKHNICGKEIYYQNYGEYAVYYRSRNYVYMMRNYYNDFSSKNRIIIDLFKIVLFDKNKSRVIKVHLKGLFDGINQFVFKK